MISQPLYSDEFVGRRDELFSLTEEFRAAVDSRVRFVTIEGDAGIGKSRLLHEFFAGIQEHATIATGHCTEHVRAPYAPFSEIVDRLDPRARLSALRPRESKSGSDEKWAYFNAVADVIRAQSARRPLAIAIEDAQWADSATTELLRFLLGRIPTARCLIMVTLRTDSLARNPAAAALRSAAARSRANAIRLRALRRHEIKHLIQAALRRSRAHLDPAMIAQIEVLAEGNALFAEELARVAVENGGLSFQTNLPVTLQAILSERLMPFSAPERGLLSRAAVAGQRFDTALLCAISDFSAEAVLGVMQRAVDCGLLEESREQPAHFCFRHALIRQALAEQLVLGLAAPLHVRIAEQLEAQPDASTRAAELAYHWSAARVAHKARFWNEAAAKSAWEMYAYRDAIRFYNDALAWGYPPGTQRAALCERLGLLLYIEGCGEEPARWFARARAEYDACGNAVGTAHALLLEADQKWVDAQTQESVRAASQAAHALKRLGHTQMYAQALLSVARFSMTLGQIDRTLAHLDAVAALREHFDAGSRAAWHEVRGETQAVLGNAAPAIAEFRAAAKLAAESGVSELVAQIENNFAGAAFDLGDLDLAMARHQIAVDESQRTGLMWRIAYSSLNYARTLMFKGEVERARAMAWEALDAGVTTATFKTKAASVGVPIALLLNDRALLAACADETAIDLAEQSAELQRIASVAAAFAALRVTQGSRGEAQALLARALRAIPHAHRAWDLFLAVAQWGHAQDVDLARGLLKRAVGRPVLKRAYTLLFEAFARRDDAAYARRAARAAAQNFSRMGNRLCEAIALECAGEDDAAADRYRGMGVVRTTERVEKSAARAESAVLTVRQSQIAKLIAKGETNRAIAAQLRISEHTVEHHVSEIFVRLGLKSRTQLAHLLGQNHDV